MAREISLLTFFFKFLLLKVPFHWVRRENFSRSKPRSEPAKKSRHLSSDLLSLSLSLSLSLQTAAVATSRRPGSLAGGGGSDWLPAPSDLRLSGDLCLGFNGGLGGGWPTTPAATTTTTSPLPFVGALYAGATPAGSGGNSRIAHSQILNYNSVPLTFPHELSMVGLRDVFLFHHATPDPQNPVFLASSAPSSSLPQNLPSVHPFPPTDVDCEKKRVAEIQLWKAGVGGVVPGEVGGVTCQDCGNQAKKDCVHRRCRTCCKSRGFDCETHVKSTWMPAARRRERQQMLPGCNSGGGLKKARLGTGVAFATASLTSTSANTPSRSFDTGSSHHEMEMGGGGGGLPGHVTVPAVFRCVRVTAIDGEDNEYAYQAVVKIGGRVFKGFLYDQGLGDSSSSSLPNLSDLHLGDYSGSVAAGGSGKNVNASSLASILDVTDAYAAAAAAASASSTGGSMLGGSNYGNQVN